MPFYSVSIDSWTTRVEAPTSDAARRIGVHVFRETVSNALPVAYVCGYLCKVRRIQPATFDSESMTEEQKEHFTGFWEGDGCTSYSKANRGPIVSLDQKEPQILEYFKQALSLNEKVRPASGGSYTLRVTRREAATQVLELLTERVVLPARAELLGRMLGTPVNEHAPTWPWTAGIFDAEGGIEPVGGGSFGLSIGQKDIRGLYSIQVLANSGIVDFDRIRWHGPSALSVVSKIYPYMHNYEKRCQIYAVLTVFNKLKMEEEP